MAAKEYEVAQPAARALMSKQIGAVLFFLPCTVASSTSASHPNTLAPFPSPAAGYGAITEIAPDATTGYDFSMLEETRARRDR
jgi:hypothetical protein